MTSRLERLFILLESGSSPATRRAAANQLGQVQKSHPGELQNLLRRLSSLLCHTSWDTRIAAGQAIEAILTQTPVWTPHESALAEETYFGDTLEFDTFDLEKIIMTGECLMSSEGKEFDKEENCGDNDKLAAQRKQLNKRLGLDVASKLGLAQDNFVDDDDFNQEFVKEEIVTKKQSASEILAAEIASVTSKDGELSSREKNMLKRKAKLEAKSIGKSSDDKELQGASKKPRIDDTSGLVSSHPWPKIEDPSTYPSWPLTTFCSHLTKGLLSPCWQTRHGAATGLRELVRIHGREGGLGEGGPGHRAWLEDLTLRVVTVLALDRFGDFVGDAVVAPVRETTAQLMGTLLPLLDPSQIIIVANIVLQLLTSEHWEARHGGLLAVKYLLAVRTDMSDQLLPRLFPPVSAGLADIVDDVVGVAAAALLPVTATLITLLPHKVSSLCIQLWDDLLELDDLTSSTHSIMALLAALLSQGEEGFKLCFLSTSPPLSQLVPRLYPFLSHSSSGVRGATLSTLRTLCSKLGLASAWLPSCVQDLLRHLYQRSLVEHQTPNLGLLVSVWNDVCANTPLEPLLMAACPWFGPWINMISGLASQPLDSSTLLPPLDTKAQYLGGLEARAFADQKKRDEAVARARHTAAQLLGRLAAYIVRPVPGLPGGEPPLQLLLDRVLVPTLATTSAHKQLAVALIVLQWVEQTSSPSGLSTSGLPSALLACLNQGQDYVELAPHQTKLLSQAKDFEQILRQHRLLGLESITIDQLTSNSIQQVISRISPNIREPLLEYHSSLVTDFEAFKSEQASLQLLTLGSLAGALAYLGPEALPDKLNPIVKPLMEALKKEDNEQFQSLAARGLTQVLTSCLSRVPSPCDKVVRNLCSFVCSNPCQTPLVDLSHLHGAVHPHTGILTLHNKERSAEEVTKAKRGKKIVKSLSSVTPLQGNTEVNNEDEMRKVEIQVRGAVSAIHEIAKHFGPALPQKVPQLWSLSIDAVIHPSVNEDPQALVNSLSVVRVLAQSTHQLLLPNLQSLIPHLLNMITHQLTAVRHMSSATLSSLASLPSLTVSVMTGVVESLLPLLDPSHPLSCRQGVVESVHVLSDELGIKIVPYIVLLVVSVLGAMSDPDQQVRLLATNTFAILVRLMPLDGGAVEPEGLPPQLIAKKRQEAGFLDQLLHSGKTENYQLAVPVSAVLRSYQVAGVNWLAFLCKYKLHGILCDDMGLGKTLQTISLLASQHAGCPPGTQSLVVCPTTLGGHWLEEINRFVSPQHLNPFLYSGPPSARGGLRQQVRYHNVIITSYDIVRNDIEFFASTKWNFLILDEGHVIKNTKTKTAVAIRQLVASHRLILTGTPIQNGVIELWALFDFLMPGYLGSEKQFTARFSRPILASRDAKSSSAEQEAGALALETLHRQTLPFILRRMKEDVLKDLPPKIIQDYSCYLSPLQSQLYQDFAKSQQQQKEEGGGESNNQHVFQALQYLRKVCNHPKLVLSPSHPSYQDMLSNHLDNNLDNLLDIRHSAKLTALKQLLTDLGMGESRNETESDNVLSPHRALIFCQLKAMIDIVETDLLAKHLPTVSYLRLDGSVPAANRHSIVSKFNSDPSIDLLLLSTSVGGLGLNLTGADTVIFVEHDWNPSKDLQAMDRAHRIGQKKVVNVYRLLTRDTIEEKIMSLQKFKIHTANTVISTDNSSLSSMQTDQVLDLFSLNQNENRTGGLSRGGNGVKTVLENLSELWEDTEYSEEYNLDNFISNLGKAVGS